MRRCRSCDIGVVAPRSPLTLRSPSSSLSSTLVQERNPRVWSTRVHVRTPTVTTLLIDKSLGVFGLRSQFFFLLFALNPNRYLCYFNRASTPILMQYFSNSDTIVLIKYFNKQS
jgi:hypothetical protein